MRKLNKFNDSFETSSLTLIEKTLIGEYNLNRKKNRKKNSSIKEPYWEKLFTNTFTCAYKRE